MGVHETAAFKNGITFIPFEERLAIVRACRYVDEAVTAGDEDSSEFDYKTLDTHELFAD